MKSITAERTAGVDGLPVAVPRVDARSRWNVLAPKGRSRIARLPVDSLPENPASHAGIVAWATLGNGTQRRSVRAILNASRASRDDERSVARQGAASHGQMPEFDA